MEKQIFTFPEIKTEGKAIVRHFSLTNPWIDFIVVVDPSVKDDARYVINKAMEEYWNSDDDCFGDLVEEALKKAEIEYDIVYHDTYDESDEYEDAWEAYLSVLYESCKNKEEFE